MPAEVTLALDEEPRTVEFRDDLAAALADDPEAQAVFDRLSFTPSVSTSSGSPAPSARRRERGG
jgi:hypothetical protein